jgi:hypothetical protein
MSYPNASRLSDEDTKAVIAYIRSVPASGTHGPRLGRIAWARRRRRSETLFRDPALLRHALIAYIARELAA